MRVFKGEGATSASCGMWNRSSRDVSISLTCIWVPHSSVWLTTVNSAILIAFVIESSAFCFIVSPRINHVICAWLHGMSLAWRSPQSPSVWRTVRSFTNWSIIFRSSSALLRRSRMNTANIHRWTWITWCYQHHVSRIRRWWFFIVLRLISPLMNVWVMREGVGVLRCFPRYYTRVVYEARAV